jgi:hypothetical protein
MPNLPWPGRREAPAIPDASLAALLAGTPPPDQSAAVQPAADVVAALRAGPARDELGGEAAALAEFRNGRARAARPTSRARRGQRPARRATRIPVRVTAAAAVAAVGIGSLASAAYVGALPTPIQRLAHATIWAPAATRGRVHQAAAPDAGHPAAAPCPATRGGTTAPARAAGTRPASTAGASESVASAGVRHPGTPCGPIRRPARRLTARAGCWPAAWPSRTSAAGFGWSRTSVPEPGWSRTAGPQPGQSGRPAQYPGGSGASGRPARTTRARQAAASPRPFWSCAASRRRSHDQPGHWPYGAGHRDRSPQPRPTSGPGPYSGTPSPQPGSGSRDGPPASSKPAPPSHSPPARQSVSRSPTSPPSRR